MKRIFVISVGAIALLALWFVTEENDYFNTDYREITSTEMREFESQSDPTMIYAAHFGEERLKFPGQRIDEIKLFDNTPIIGTLTSKTLKENFNLELIQFFNDPENFDWDETTWSYRESEYILRFYNQDKIVGKVYICLDDCGMIGTSPFTPNVKFGGLTRESQEELKQIVKDNSMWK